MNNLIIYIIIGIISVLAIYLVSRNKLSTSKLEHLTIQSDEAIQNINSMFNKDKLIITNANITGTLSGKAVEDINRRLDAIDQIVLRAAGR